MVVTSSDNGRRRSALPLIAAADAFVAAAAADADAVNKSQFDSKKKGRERITIEWLSLASARLSGAMAAAEKEEEGANGASKATKQCPSKRV